VQNTRNVMNTYTNKKLVKHCINSKKKLASVFMDCQKVGRRRIILIAPRLYEIIQSVRCERTTKLVCAWIREGLGFRS